MKIKEIKIVNQDQSTEIANIGADAINVDYDDTTVKAELDKLNTVDNTLELKLNKKPYYYDNVAAMKADNKLKNGDCVQTLGYYSANDGGGATYQIVNDSTLVDDGGSVHDITNGLKAKLVVDGTINVKQFGAKGDGIADDTSKIQNALAKLDTVYLNKGTYLVSQIVLDDGKCLIGKDKNKTIIKSNTSDFALKTFGSGQLHFITLKNLTIDCNGISDGIYLGDHISGVIYNSRHLVDNILILNQKNVALEDESMGSSFNNITVNGNFAGTDANGFYFHGTDSFISNCRVYKCDGNGLVMSGVNYQMVNCKYMVNHGKGGQITDIGYCLFSNVVFEENNYDGLSISSANDCFFNIKCGANGTTNEGNTAELHIVDRVRNCIFEGVLEPYSNTGNIKYGILVERNNYNNTFEFVHNIANINAFQSSNYRKIKCNSTFTNSFIINNRKSISADIGQTYTDKVSQITSSQPSAITITDNSGKSATVRVDSVSAINLNEIRIRLILPSNTKNFSIRLILKDTSYNLDNNNRDFFYETIEYIDTNGASKSANNYSTAYVDRSNLDLENKAMCYESDSSLITNDIASVTNRWVAFCIPKEGLGSSFDLEISQIELAYDTFQ